MSGTRFTDGFKRDAVVQVVDRGYAVWTYRGIVPRNLFFRARQSNPDTGNIISIPIRKKSQFLRAYQGGDHSIKASPEANHSLSIVGQGLVS